MKYNMFIKKGEKLGQGVMGEVYASSINNTPCILKIERRTQLFTKLINICLQIV